MHFRDRTENINEPEHNEMANLKVKSSDLILFTTQLSIMLDSGVVLSDAIEVIAEQSNPGNFRDIIEDIAERIKNGDSFSKALANYPKVFNSMFISMVRASEASGQMPEMLTILSGYINDDDETKKKVESEIENVKSVMKGDDVDAIKTATEALTAASHKLAELMYAQAAQENPDGEGGGGAENQSSEKEKDDDVVDADYEEVK